jgi:hypothetical protein
MTSTPAHHAPQHRGFEESFPLRRGRETNCVETTTYTIFLTADTNFDSTSFTLLLYRRGRLCLFFTHAFPFLNVRHHDHKATAVGSFILEEFFRRRCSSLFPCSLFLSGFGRFLLGETSSGVLWGKWVKHGWQQGYGHTTTISRPQAGTERMLLDKHERALGSLGVSFLFIISNSTRATRRLFPEGLVVCLLLAGRGGLFWN